jgi:hypothetical protein
MLSVPLATRKDKEPSHPRLWFRYGEHDAFGAAQLAQLLFILVPVAAPYHGPERRSGNLELPLGGATRQPAAERLSDHLIVPLGAINLYIGKFDAEACSRPAAVQAAVDQLQLPAPDASQ